MLDLDSNDKYLELCNYLQIYLTSDGSLVLDIFEDEMCLIDEFTGESGISRKSCF